MGQCFSFLSKQNFIKLPDFEGILDSGDGNGQEMQDSKSTDDDEVENRADLPSDVVWIPDDQVQFCQNDMCKKVFTVVIRKHHCRECGNIFCGECARTTSEAFPPRHPRPIRLCPPCNEALTRRKRFMSEHLERLKTGATFVKHGRKGTPHRRFISLTEDGEALTWTDLDNNTGRVERLPLNTVIEVRNGQTTEVFKRTGRPGKDNVTFSLVTSDRTLDLECDSKEIRDLWSKALSEAVLVAKRNTDDKNRRSSTKMMTAPGTPGATSDPSGAPRPAGAAPVFSEDATTAPPPGPLGIFGMPISEEATEEINRKLEERREERRLAREKLKSEMKNKYNVAS
eukprot:TRINITY_DN6763_c0_g1::TRINITY_DN6763_c0_g1_i1::g.3039::m.3039 TRINITY_DN6763_c0_g1::TRINITY_DN6763_c0_g1_i1::g.3039  ORF type:complete len:361 (-),score=71.21,sp/Q8BIJ7/RUFY1_MOUSE/41.18/1e-12,FYVE/PF01363.16/3.2e-16,Mcp5_PH/PF12814.2/4.9e-09,PH/PF00169.24/1.2e-05,PH_2/PF08458.5/0.0034,zf-AN1/PF01428.11/0.22,IBR/PF01485.16/0.095,IBR/PF01485.16/3.8e+03 TRINITY_DN6763_c0_g1_i1:38-1060(-)